MAAATLAEIPSSSSSAIWSEFSKRVLIKNIISRPDGGVDLAGEKIKVGGWVKTGRQQGKGSFAFLELNDGSCPENLQVIVDSSVVELSQIKPPQGTKQQVELKVEKVLEIGGVDHPAANKKYPLPKTKLTLEFLRDYLHLRPRTNTISAVARIRNALSYTTHTFFQKHGFLNVQTPIITTIDCEGAGELLIIQRLFERQAFLTVSGQLQVETLACALGNVYTFGPTFRAEHSHTSRHLAEFWMVEPELAFADLEDDMNCAEAYVKFLSQWLLDNCLDDMQLMVKNFDKNAIDRLKLVSSTPFERITYTDAVTLLGKVTENRFENAVEWGIDLASEHERYLTEVIFNKPVIVYNYPKGIKPFYMRLNDDDKTVAAMDVLVPKGCHDPYQWYLDLRRYGTVKHSGFGLGFERMVLFCCWP
ncbi:hypothetical protein MKW92_020249 [Papaver armeniacum]|nr:hypothetical protein MKW92_020249 [Papaver armeniacum]